MFPLAGYQTKLRTLVSPAALGPDVTLSILDMGFWSQSRAARPAMAGGGQ